MAFSIIKISLRIKIYIFIKKYLFLFMYNFIFAFFKKARRKYCFLKKNRFPFFDGFACLGCILDGFNAFTKCLFVCGK